MDLTADMIITRRGTILPLDQRRRDALANYAEAAAINAGKPVQTWVREAWKLKDYEAKDLIKGNASEVVWERILKLRGPHCGWAIAIPILGAVIGEDLSDYFASEKERVADERARWAAEEDRVSTLEAFARERRSFARHRAGEADLRAGRAARGPRLASPPVGRGEPAD
jgi:hypothetical protein